MIEVISVNPINKGDMLASVSVAIRPWKLKIHEITVMQKGVNRWVNLPQRKYEANGETKYAKQLEFDDAGVEKRFRDQIMAAVDEYIMRNGDLVPEDVVKEEEPFPF
jgi:DNA-binding cell septation regulator SpoVG